MFIAAASNKLNPELFPLDLPSSAEAKGKIVKH